MTNPTRFATLDTHASHRQQAAQAASDCAGLVGAHRRAWGLAAQPGQGGGGEGEWQEAAQHESNTHMIPNNMTPFSTLENTAPASGQQSVLAEAEQLINGPRRDSYGDARDSFERVASMWSVILKRSVTAHEVALCMIALKLCREANKHSRDSLVDIAGYAGLAEKVCLL